MGRGDDLGMTFLSIHYKLQTKIRTAAEQILSASDELLGIEHDGVFLLGP